MCTIFGVENPHSLEAAAPVIDSLLFMRGENVFKKTVNVHIGAEIHFHLRKKKE
jgi:hypothetical protein